MVEEVTGGVSNKSNKGRDRPKSVFTWTVNDVQKWLRRHCSDYYQQYGTLFLSNEVTGRALLRLNDNSLLRLGILDCSHRDALWREILKLRLKTDIVEIGDIQRRDVYNMSYNYYIS